MVCIVVRLEHLKASKFLIEQLQWLELLCLLHLRLEPVFRLLLLDLLQVRMIVVDMSVA